MHSAPRLQRFATPKSLANFPLAFFIVSARYNCRPGENLVLEGNALRLPSQGGSPGAFGFRSRVLREVGREFPRSQGGRISVEIVEEEIQRLKATWTALEEQTRSEEFLSQILSVKALGEIDLFDRVQLAHMIQVCRDSRSMSEAGRQLFDASRTRKTSTNDADRLRKYLGRFGIEWNQIVES